MADDTALEHDSPDVTRRRFLQTGMASLSAVAVMPSIPGLAHGGAPGRAHVAFTNPDGSTALVLTNGGGSPVTPRIVLGGRAVQVTSPADSITTLQWRA
jgi:O-glycosyl hydrolase